MLVIKPYLHRFGRLYVLRHEWQCRFGSFRDVHYHCEEDSGIAAGVIISNTAKDRSEASVDVLALAIGILADDQDANRLSFSSDFWNVWNDES
jgi:hypothetical protein